MTTGTLDEPTRRRGGDSRRLRWPWALAIAAFVAVVVGAGVLPRLRARSEVSRDTEAMSVPVVSVARPKRAAPINEVILPASIRGYREAAIFARTNGYLRRWYVDIGARVKKGQLLAEIATPEVDRQLEQARADLATTVANRELSQVTAKRYAGLLEADSVARQEADNAAGDFAAKSALVRSAQANVKRLEDLTSFQKVYAPFDGVITARNTDIGALIDAGAAGAGSQLFFIAQPERLRVYVNVPESYARAARPGLTVDLSVAERPGQRSRGTIATTANAIDPATRTLLVQIAVDNRDGALLPGAFTRVHLTLPNETPAVVVPAGALLFRAEGLRVGVVGPGNRVELRPITIARDLGPVVEVASGLTGEEAVIASPPDSLLAGQVVRIASPSRPEDGSAPPP
jgi:RND family efflux transporter MFP subunit